jgi:phage/plasmid primase-like uncharacterized protein
VNYNPHRNPDDHSITIAQLKELARGRWIEILTAAGVPAELLADRRGKPCPKCSEGDDRFAPMNDLADRGAVLCRICFNATTTPRAGDGIASLQWWLECSISEAIQWLKSYLGIGAGVHRAIHRTAIKPNVPPKPSKPVQSESDRLRIELMADVCGQNLSDASRKHIAQSLGVTSEALRRLRVGWNPSQCAMTWPMRDGDGNIIGIRLREPKSGAKYSATGSHAGLFYDPDIHANISPGARIWIAEGASDTSALLSLELDAVGVPSSGCGGDLLLTLGRRIRPREWVIVRDNDEAGAEGARKLRSDLVIVAPVRVIEPPIGIKDARAWLNRGASRDDLEREANTAEVFGLEWNNGGEA